MAISSKNKQKVGAPSGVSSWFRSMTQWVPSQEQRKTVCRWALFGLAVTALVFVVVGSLEIRDRTRSDARFYVNDWPIQIGSLPAWVTPEIDAQLRAIRLGSEDDRICLFERGALLRIQAAVERVSWIREVTDVRVSYPTVHGPGTLDLKMRLRTPIALVEHRGLFYLTDDTGVRVGSPYREARPDWFRVPTIRNIPDAGELPGEGERWTARDVEQGLAVAKVLHESGIHRDFPHRLVEMIDLSNLRGVRNSLASEIVLHAGGQKLNWGRSPISGGGRPVVVRDIIANLRHVLANQGVYRNFAVIRLDSPPGALTGVRG